MPKNSFDTESAIVKRGKPLPDTLSGWGSGSRMLYVCPKCGASLRIYGQKQNYCHLCGKKLNWTKCPEYASEKFKELWDNAYEECQKASGEVDWDLYKQKLTDLKWQWYKNITN